MKRQIRKEDLHLTSSLSVFIITNRKTVRLMSYWRKRKYLHTSVMQWLMTLFYCVTYSTLATLGINSMARQQLSHDIHSLNDGKQCWSLWWIALWYIMHDVTERTAVTEFPRITNLVLYFSNYFIINSQYIITKWSVFTWLVWVVVVQLTRERICYWMHTLQ